MKKQIAAIIGFSLLILGYIAACLAVPVGVIYIILHFACKFW